MTKIHSAMSGIRDALPKIGQDKQAQKSDEAPAPRLARDAIEDRWEDGVNAADDLWKQVTGAGEDDGEFDAGMAQSIAEGLGGMLEFFELSADELQAYTGVARGVENAVSLAVDEFSSAANQLGVQHALSEFCDLGARVQHYLADEGQAFAEDPQRLQRELEQLGMEATSKMVSEANSALNKVGESVAEVIVDQRHHLETGAEALRLVDDDLGELDLLWGSLDLVMPIDGLAEATTRMAIRTWAGAMDVTGELAEHFSSTEGLPTEENFDAWLDEIAPGEARKFGGSLKAKLVKVLGMSVEGGRELEIERSESDPNRITVTFKDDSKTSVNVGKGAQDQGATTELGAAWGREAKLEFDLSRPEDRELLESTVLCSQGGWSSSRIIALMDERLTSMTTEISVEAAVKAGGGILKSSAEASLGATHTQEKRDEGMVDRFGVRYESQLKAGKTFGQVPGLVVESLQGQARTPDELALATRLGDLSGGKIGAKAEVSAEVVAGFELIDGRVERLFAELTVDGEVLGQEGSIEVDLVVHRPQELARAMDTTPQELSESFSSGDLRLDELVSAAGAAGLDPEEVLGFQIKAKRVESDGLDVSLLGVEVTNKMERTDTKELLTYGTVIDRSAPTPGDDLYEEANSRRLDRQFFG